MPREIGNAGHSFSSISNKTILFLKRSENCQVYAKPNQHKTTQCLRANGRFSPLLLANHASVRRRSGRFGFESLRNSMQS